MQCQPEHHGLLHWSKPVTDEWGVVSLLVVKFRGLPRKKLNRTYIDVAFVLWARVQSSSLPPGCARSCMFAHQLRIRTQPQAYTRGLLDRVGLQLHVLMLPARNLPPPIAICNGAGVHDGAAGQSGAAARGRRCLQGFALGPLPVST